ncbi:hypothetical protein, partial [Sphingomonas sp. CCH9-H8]|uniref:hypothetical protein n=1 Tax=Sphingomonas sp. CCH9-H8 TaxID=1768772 RepID=UPI0018D212F0
MASVALGSPGAAVGAGVAVAVGSGCGSGVLSSLKIRFPAIDPPATIGIAAATHPPHSSPAAPYDKKIEFRT